MVPAIFETFSSKRGFTAYNETSEPETSLQLGCPSPAPILIDEQRIGIRTFDNNFDLKPCVEDELSCLTDPLMLCDTLSFSIPSEIVNHNNGKRSHSPPEDSTITDLGDHDDWECYGARKMAEVQLVEPVTFFLEPNAKKFKSEERQELGFYHKKRQFRDHIWTYAQMFRAETSMAFLADGDFEGEVVQNHHGNSSRIDPNEGVELVQLLFACAEAVACRDARQASGIINELAYLVSPLWHVAAAGGDLFYPGLALRLNMLLSSNSNQNNSRNNNNNSSNLPPLPLNNIKEPSERDKEEALRHVYEACPYIPLDILRQTLQYWKPLRERDYVHVVDLGMTSGLSRGLQWCSLVESLVARRGGPPRLLRVTGVGSSEAVMTEIGAQMKEHAQSLGLALEFRAVETALENVVPSALDVRHGEALAVNSVLELHCVVKESRGSLNSVLQAIHKLRPRVLTLVEQDANHNGPFFLGRFMEALYYYSAIFDSLDAILPRPSTQRVKIEQYHFGEEIKNIVSCEGPTRVERHERVDQWRRRMSRAGFQSSPLKIVPQAKAWLGQNFPCDGYTVSEQKGCLVLGWRGKPIIAASCWKC